MTPAQPGANAATWRNFPWLATTLNAAAAGPDPSGDSCHADTEILWQDPLHHDRQLDLDFANEYLTPLFGNLGYDVELAWSTGGIIPHTIQLWTVDKDGHDLFCVYNADTPLDLYNVPMGACGILLRFQAFNFTAQGITKAKLILPWRWANVGGVQTPAVSFPWQITQTNKDQSPRWYHFPFFVYLSTSPQDLSAFWPENVMTGITPPLPPPEPYNLASKRWSSWVLGYWAGLNFTRAASGPIDGTGAVLAPTWQCATPLLQFNATAHKYKVSAPSPWPTDSDGNPEPWIEFQLQTYG
jgi:hypothetical protein